MRRLEFTVLLAAVIALTTLSAAGDYVIPAIGGDQDTTEPMIHATFTYNNATNVMTTYVQNDVYGYPLLRSLSAPNQFDPNTCWGRAITGEEYNFQYGLMKNGMWTIPNGAAVWFEQTAVSSPELQCYYGKKNTGDWEGLFGTPTPAGNGPPTMPDMLLRYDPPVSMMVHNTYAVLNPTHGKYWATYHVYIGDAVTGAPIDGTGSADFTLTWRAQPIWLPGDANCDGTVDFKDYIILESNFGKSNMFFEDGDANCDGTVDFKDYIQLEGNFGKSLTVPEPAAMTLLLAGVFALRRRR